MAVEASLLDAAGLLPGAERTNHSSPAAGGPHLVVEARDVGLQIGDVLQLAQPAALRGLAIGNDAAAQLLAAAGLAVRAACGGGRDRLISETAGQASKALLRA